MSCCTTDKQTGPRKSPADNAMPLRRPRDQSLVKADVRIEQRDDGALAIVKDFSACNPLVRSFYGRILLWREARAYERLHNVPGIPRYFGRDGRYSIAFEYIDSRPLGSFKRGTVPAAVFDRLDQTMQLMHARGVAHGDLHRANILVSNTGEVHIVDFASAFIAHDPAHPGIAFRVCRKIDHNAAARMRARFFRTQKPRPAGILGIFYTAGKLFRRIGKKIS